MDKQGVLKKISVIWVVVVDGSSMGRDYFFPLQPKSYNVTATEGVPLSIAISREIAREYAEMMERESIMVSLDVQTEHSAAINWGKVLAADVSIVKLDIVPHTWDLLKSLGYYCREDLVLGELAK